MLRMRKTSRSLLACHRSRHTIPALLPEVSKRGEGESAHGDIGVRRKRSKVFTKAMEVIE